MNRVEIKNKAKEMIKGNKWFLWKPLLIISIALALIEGIAFGLDSAFGLTREATYELAGAKITYTGVGIISMIVGVCTGFASSAFGVAYSYYVLSFVRGKKLEMSDITEFMKKHWVIAFLVGLVTGLIVLCGMILLVIPGIIAAVGLMFYREVCADNPDMKTMDIVKKAWEMTKNHKMELFIFGLSFIGWFFVSAFTFGILYIWLMPYMIVTFTLAYEELRNKKAA